MGSRHNACLIVITYIYIYIHMILMRENCFQNHPSIIYISEGYTRQLEGRGLDETVRRNGYTRPVRRTMPPHDFETVVSSNRLVN